MSTPASPISTNPGFRAPANHTVHPDRTSKRSTKTKSVDGPDFRKVFEHTAKRISSGQRNVDRALRMARRGGTLSNEQLLVLQTTVYRFTQEVEMASKLVDKATGALRQTLQSQQ